MPIVSYAQNFEDIMLWRALRHISSGFYIDIGANDPDIESVTRLFYDNGWQGINVEPLSGHHAALTERRPRDINIQAAIGNARGTIEIWEPEVRGWATASTDVMQQHQQSGIAGRLLTVPQQTLADLCNEHVAGDIHFLKVDVEGLEKAVLEGADSQHFRPWILVIEATEPNSTRENFSEWEPIVTDAGYQLAYCDGLNRFYVAEERNELAAAFRYPPNVFDDFQPAELFLAEARLSEVTQKTEAEIQRTKAELEENRALLESEKAQRQSMENSLSWRITAPLRDVNAKVIEFRRRIFPVYAKKMLWVAVKHLNRHPSVKKKVHGSLSRWPSLYNAIAAIKNGALDDESRAVSRPRHAAVLHPRVLPVVPQLPEALLLPSVPSEQKSRVRFVGHIEGHYSLAIVNRGLAAALESLTAGNLQFVPYHGEPYTKVPVLDGEQGLQLQPAMERELSTEQASSLISIVHHYPLIHDERPAGLHGMIFFWEETSVPPHIIEHINEHMNLLWVSAESVKKALLDSGCSIPVFIIPLGIDHLIKPGTKPVQEVNPSTDKPLRFLHVSSAFARKGVDVLLEAYMQAFTGDDAVELYIKTFPNPHNHVKSQLEALIAAHANPPEVIIDEAPLDDEGLMTLYRSASALISPSRGEGFNLPAAEAMAMGLPVITTGAGAHIDFCTLDTATLVDFQFFPSDSHLRATDACWFEPDTNSLAKKLQQTAQRIQEGDPSLYAQRQTAMHHVRDTYKWEKSAQALLASSEWFGKYGPGCSALTHVASVTPWASACGIAEYSRNLLQTLVNEPSITLDIYSDDRTQKPGQGVNVSWSLGDNEKVIASLRQVAQTPAQGIVVQHQPSLFELTDSICQELAALAEAGRVVVLELHATTPLLAENALSPEAVSALLAIERIIVHTPGDLNNLLKLGLFANVTLLEHGVVQPLEPSPENARTELGIPEDALVLGSFGFALPHKGLDTLVSSVAALQKNTDRPVHLVGINSVLDERSKRLLKSCQQQARKEGVEQQIHWVSDYQPIETCQRLLAAADYIVFPYRQTRESASGAVTIGLSALRPVLVSPLEIFSDLGDVTVTMDGADAADIEAAITRLEVDPELKQRLIERQHQWLKSRDWQVISSRFKAVLEALAQDRRLASALAPAKNQYKKQWLAKRRRQLLVDVSELYYRNARTGIQRVVCNWLDELWRQRPEGYDICPIYSSNGDDFRHTSRFTPENATKYRDESPVVPTPGDVFFGLDLAAHLFPAVEHRLREYRQSGVRIVYMVYDILPLTQPEYFDHPITKAFKPWAEGIARNADQLVGISDATVDDLRQWLTTRANVPSCSLPQMNSVHLGADFQPAERAENRQGHDRALIERLASEKTFLMVGTIEPRKGHQEVLDAFDALWRQGYKINLVIVGKKGWMVERLADRITNHKQAGRRLVWLSGVSDAYLEELYGVSRCLIAASHAEGFGLPLIEAAQRGVPVIARDIPVFREVAGEHVFYFDNGRNLVNAIQQWLKLYEQQQHPASDQMQWLTWQQSAARLLQVLGVTASETENA